MLPSGSFTEATCEKCFTLLLLKCWTGETKWIIKKERHYVATCFEVRCWFGVALNLLFLLNTKLFLFILKGNVLHSVRPVHSHSSTQLFYFAWYKYPFISNQSWLCHGSIFLRAQKLIKIQELLPCQSFPASLGAAVHSFKRFLCPTQHCSISLSAVFPHGEGLGLSGLCPEAAQELLPAFLCRNWSSACTTDIYSSNALLPSVTMR